MKTSLLSILFLLCLSALTVNGQKQGKDAAVDANSTVPVSYGIVVDNSGSYRTILDKVVEVVKDIVEENKEGDETFLVTFISTDKIKLQQDFTEHKGDIHDAADQMYIEGGKTAILDGVFFAAKYLVEKAGSGLGRRKALILITDGDDRGSSVKYEELIKVLKDGHISVFALGLSDEKVFTRLLDRITRDTGGRFFTPKTNGDLTATLKSLTSAIRTK